MAEQAAVANGAANGQEEGVLYFAFGSMVNPVSKKRRKIFPSMSWPAKLPGYALKFNAGGMGMGNIEPEASASMQGVVHRVTPSEWKSLCEMEHAYQQVEVEVEPYDPDNGNAPLPPLKAWAFIVQPGKGTWTKNDALPTERYIDIICRGLAHYKVDPAYIAQVAATPCVPRRTPGQYLTARAEQPLAQLPLWTPDQVMAYRERVAEDGCVYFALRHKVARIKLPAPDPSAGEAGAQKLARESGMLIKFYSGKDATFGMLMGLYEPLLPEVDSPADVTDEHAAWAEDLACQFCTDHGMPMPECVGRLEEVVPVSFMS